MKSEVAKELIELEGVRAVYLGGSRVQGGETDSSDWDFFGIVDSNYDFDREDELNENLSSKYDSKIRFRGISIQELNGGNQKGVLTQYIPIEILIKSFSKWKHLGGKSYSLNHFELKPASIQTEMRFYLERLSNYRKEAENSSLPFPFDDYVKTVLLLINIQQVIRGEGYTLNYQKIAKRSSEEEEKLTSLCIEYRNSNQIDKDRFFRELDKYLQKIRNKLDLENS
jgi:hypothetical protein